MLNKYLYLFFFLIITTLISCTVGEPKLEPRQQREIENKVRVKVDSFSRVQWKHCLSEAALAAQPQVDSIIASFADRIPKDALKQPTKPPKPEKPTIEIPAFEETVGPN